MTEPPMIHTVPPPPPPDGRMPASNRFVGVLNVLGVYILVAALFAIGPLVSPAKFLTELNLLSALQSVALMGIVAMGVAFITYSRHYVDLSIPGIMAISGVVAVWALKFGFAASMLAGLAAGAAVGVVNGLVVGYLRLNPIIWTLAVASVLSGLIRWVYSGQQLYPDERTSAGWEFLNLYNCQILGKPLLPAIVLVVAAVAAHLLMHHTAYGASLKLTGSNYEAARLSGIPVRRVVGLTFVISSVTSAAAGILLTSFNKVGAEYVGKGYDFMAVTAVVLGGMTLAGGRGNVIGVLGGVIAIALMTNVMSLMRIPPLHIGPWAFGEITIGTFWQNIIQGAIFILVVGINSLSLRKAGRDDS